MRKAIVGGLVIVMVIVSGYAAVAGGVVEGRYDGWKAADMEQATVLSPSLLQPYLSQLIQNKPTHLFINSD